MKASTDAVDTLTAPTPVLPDAVLPASQSPHSLALWGRQLSQSPLKLFPIALGAGSFGWSTDDRGAAEIIDEFIELGGNFLDATGSGADDRGEAAVGGWLARRGSRARVLVGTTIGHHHDLSDEPAPVIARDVNAALSRLRTDHLDLLSVQFGADTPTDEVLVAVDDLIRSGKVRFLAASAPSADRLMETRVVAAQQDLSPLVAVQASYSLAHRSAYEADLAGIVALQAGSLMPRQPLAGGLLAGPRAAKPTGKADRPATMLPARRWPALKAAMVDAGQKLGVGAPSIALAWLLTRPQVVAPIVSVSSTHQLEEAMSAVRVQLTRQQTAELDRLSR